MYGGFLTVKFTFDKTSQGVAILGRNNFDSKAFNRLIIKYAVGLIYAKKYYWIQLLSAQHFSTLNLFCSSFQILAQDTAFIKFNTFSMPFQ